MRPPVRTAFELVPEAGIELRLRRKQAGDQPHADPERELRALLAEM